MRLHIGTDTLQKPSDVYKGDGRMKIKKMIQFILFTAVIFSLTGCGKSYEKKIEERYGIEIEGADNDTLKIIDEYFVFSSFAKISMKGNAIKLIIVAPI